MTPGAIAGVAVFWVLNYCVDSCFPTDRFPDANPRWEMATQWMEQDNKHLRHTDNVKKFEDENTKTRCIQARNDLLDKAAKANRWVSTHCDEQPANGHFNYLEEGTH